MQGQLDKLDRMRLEAMVNVAKAAHRKRVKTFVVIGRSGKPIALLFNHVWKALFPKEPLPKMFSLGSFISVGNVIFNPSLLGSLGGKELLKRNPALRERLNSRIMLFDDFATRGTTLRIAKRVFQEAGAKHLTTAVLFASQLTASPFLPQEGELLRFRKIADVIGGINKDFETSEQAVYYRKRALIGASSKHVKIPRTPFARQKHLELNQIRAHLKSLGKMAGAKLK